MSIVNNGIRASAVAVALGLSLAGPHSVAIADADTGTSGSTSASSNGAKSSGARSNGAKSSGAGSSAAGESDSRSAARSERPSGPATSSAASSAAAQKMPAVVSAKSAHTPTLRTKPTEAPTTAFRGTGSPRAVPTTREAPAPEVPTRDAETSAALVAAPVAAALTGSPVQRFLDAVATWLSTLPANPITDALEGGLLLIRRTLFPSADPEPQLPDSTPVVTTPTITIHNSSATDTMWIYNLTTSGDYSISSTFVPIEIAPLGSAPVTLAVGTGTPGSPQNRIYIVDGPAGFSLPVDASSGVDAFDPTALTAENSFFNYNFLEYYLYPANGGYEYTIDTSYIDEWSLPIQFKFTTNGADWSGAVSGTTYGFNDFDTVVNQLTAAGGPYSDLVWSGSTPWTPQPPDTISRIIGPDKVWTQQSFEPSSNINMNTTGWVPTSYQNFVQGTVTNYTNPYYYNGTLYSATGNFNFWKDSVNGPASTPYPIALRTAAILDGFPAVDGVYGFFTYPNDETAGQFTNIPTAVSLDIYISGVSDGLTDSAIGGGTWLYSAPASTPGFPNPYDRATLTGTEATETFILNYLYKKPYQSPLIQASSGDHDIVVIDPNAIGATSTSVDFVEVANFKGTHNFTSQFVYERSTGNLYYIQNPSARRYTAVLANLSESEILPEHTIYVL